MHIKKLKTILNHPLPEYIKLKDWIIFKYQGSDLKFLLETVFLALVVNREANKIGEFKVGINCKEDFKSWIPDSIGYFDFNQTKIELPGIYKITQFSHLRTNHAELAKSLGIPYPLALKDPFSDSSVETTKSVVISCNGMKEISLPEKHEKYICEYFGSRGYMIKVLRVPDYYYKVIGVTI